MYTAFIRLICPGMVVLMYLIPAAAEPQQASAAASPVANGRFPIVTAQSPAAKGTAAPGLASLRSQLDQISREADDSMQTVVKKAYIGYLGLSGADLLPGQKVLDRAETMFSDLNHLLHTDVEPLIQKGKLLAQAYSEQANDSSYLERFKLRELRVKGLTFSNSEDYQQGSHYLQQAAAQAAKIGDHRTRAFALNNLAYCYFHLQRVEDAVQSQQQALDLAKQVDDPATTSLFAYNLGWLRLHSRQFEAAAPLFEEAAEISKRANIPVREVACRLNLASIQLLQGQLQDAARNLDVSRTVSNRINSLRLRVMTAFDSAVLMALRNEPAQSSAGLTEMRSLMETSGDGVFMEGEKAFLEQKIVQLAQDLEQRFPGSGASHIAAAGTQAGYAEKNVHLHSHFNHLTVLEPHDPPKKVSAAARAAAEKDARRPLVRVTMKAVTTPLNTSFTTPVYLSTPPEIKIGFISMEVTYPKNAFSFFKVEKSFQIQSSKYEVEAKTSDHPTDKRSMLARITLTAGEDEGKKLVLPNGLILYLSFNVPKQVPHRLVQLRNKIIKAETIDGGSVPLRQLVAENQSVSILTAGMTPVTLCFFYIH